MQATRSDGRILLLTHARADELDRALSALLPATERLAHDGPSEHELRSAKRALLRQLELRFESNAEVASALSTLLAFGDPVQRLPEIRKQVAAITREDARRAAARYLARDARVLLIAGPYERGDRQLWRLSAPTSHRLDQ